jgi:hypothetical protein
MVGFLQALIYLYILYICFYSMNTGLFFPTASKAKQRNSGALRPGQRPFLLRFPHSHTKNVTRSQQQRNTSSNNKTIDSFLPSFRYFLVVTKNTKHKIIRQIILLTVNIFYKNQQIRLQTKESKWQKSLLLEESQVCRWTLGLGIFENLFSRSSQYPNTRSFY